MTTNLCPYPAYKPTVAKWLGDVPEHWKIFPLKHWVGVNEAVLSETTESSLEFTYLEIGSVNNGQLVEQPLRIRFSDAPSRARRIVRQKDTIISTVRTYLKAVWFANKVDGHVVCSTGFAVLTPHKEVDPKFVSYLVRSPFFTDRVTAESIGMAYPAISEGRLSSFHVCVPPLSEQIAIARYLDHVDSRIQRYIRAKEQLIELLTEQKQAVINQAVTRGLDPNVPLKPSSIEWLGDVPAHWEVVRSRFLFHEINVRSETGKEAPLSMSQSLGLVPSHMVERTLTAQTHTGAKLCKDGDLVLNRLKAHLGVFAIASQEGVVSPDYTVFRRRRDHIDMQYFEYVLRLPTFRTELRKRAKGIVEGFWRLYTDDFFDIRLPVPPFGEQEKVTKFLQTQTADIESAIDRTRRQIELMQEYRTRLIADVVTGKLDVRGAVAEEIDIPTP